MFSLLLRSLTSHQVTRDLNNYSCEGSAGPLAQTGGTGRRSDLH